MATPKQTTATAIGTGLASVKPTIKANPRDTQTNPTVFASNTTADQIAKTPAPSGVKTTTSTPATPAEKNAYGAQQMANNFIEGNNTAGKYDPAQIERIRQQNMKIAEAQSGMTNQQVLDTTNAAMKEGKLVNTDTRDVSGIAEQVTGQPATSSGDMPKLNLAEGEIIVKAEEIQAMKNDVNLLNQLGQVSSENILKLIENMRNQTDMFGSKLQEVANLKLGNGSTPTMGGAATDVIDNLATSFAQKPENEGGWIMDPARRASDPSINKAAIANQAKATGEAARVATPESMLTSDQQKDGAGKITAPVVTGNDGLVDPAKQEAVDYFTNYLNGINVSGLDPTADGNGYRDIFNNMSQLIVAGIIQSNDVTTKIMDNLNRRAELVEDEKALAIARTQSQEDRGLNRAAREKESALDSTQYAMDKDLRRKDYELDLMSDRNARMTGYLKGKFAAMGMLDSSAGVDLLSKYMSASEMQLAYAMEDRTETQMMYLGKMDEIRQVYADTVYDIEDRANMEIQNATLNASKALLDIDNSRIQTLDTKMKNTIGAAKELANTQLQIRQMAKQEVMQETQMALDTMKFEHQKTMDFEKNSQWAKEFGLTEAQWEETKNMNVWQKDTWQQTFNFNKTQATWDNDYKVKTFNEGVRQFSEQQKLDLRKTMSAEQGQKWDMLMQMAPGMDEQSLMNVIGTQFPEVMGEMMASTSSMADVTYNGGSLPDRVGMAEATAAKKRAQMGDAYQCVQFARDIVADLPTGLYTLQDKLDILVDSQFGTSNKKAGMPGAVIVQGWKGDPNSTSGHVAVVKDVDVEGGRYLITQFNKPAGKHSEEWVSMDDASIKGFWTSPKLGYERSNTAIKQNFTDQIGGALQSMMGMFGSPKEDGEVRPATGQSGTKMVDMFSGITGAAQTMQGMFNPEKPEYMDFTGAQDATGAWRNTPTPQFTSSGVRVDSFGKPTDAQAKTSPMMIDTSQMEGQAKQDATFFMDMLPGAKMAAKDKEMLAGQFQQALNDGDVNRANALLNNVVTAGLEGDDKKNYPGLHSSIGKISTIQSKLGELGNSNVYRAFLENNVNGALGQSKNPAFQEVRMMMQDLTAQMRNSLVGAAVTPQEAKMVNEFLPSMDEMTDVELARYLTTFKTMSEREIKAITQRRTGGGDRLLDLDY